MWKTARGNGEESIGGNGEESMRKWGGEYIEMRRKICRNMQERMRK